MSLIDGLIYNLRGLRMGLRTGPLLFWGLIRFFLSLAIILVLAGLVLAYQREMVELMWTKPQSPWIVWLWYLVSWIISLLLLLVSAFVSFLFSQLLFSAVIMDHMSRITESLIQGHVTEPEKTSSLKTASRLIRQEVPRALIPVVVSLLMLVLGWVTPLAPLLAVLASVLAAIFLAWDSTDLVPARRFLPFADRWRLLRRNPLFHLGFGLPFLIPVLNLLFLSFAPVGATLYYLEKHGVPKRT